MKINNNKLSKDNLMRRPRVNFSNANQIDDNKARDLELDETYDFIPIISKSKENQEKNEIIKTNSNNIQKKYSKNRKCFEGNEVYIHKNFRNNKKKNFDTFVFKNRENIRKKKSNCVNDDNDINFTQSNNFNKKNASLYDENIELTNQSKNNDLQYNNIHQKQTFKKFMKQNSTKNFVMNKTSEMKYNSNNNLSCGNINIIQKVSPSRDGEDNLKMPYIHENKSQSGNLFKTNSIFKKKNKLKHYKDLSQKDKIKTLINTEFSKLFNFEANKYLSDYRGEKIINKYNTKQYENADYGIREFWNKKIRQISEVDSNKSGSPQNKEINSKNVNKDYDEKRNYKKEISIRAKLKNSCNESFKSKIDKLSNNIPTYKDDSRNSNSDILNQIKIKKNSTDKEGSSSNKSLSRNMNNIQLFIDNFGEFTNKNNLIPNNENVKNNNFDDTTAIQIPKEKISNLGLNETHDLNDADPNLMNQDIIITIENDIPNNAFGGANENGNRLTSSINDENNLKEQYFDKPKEISNIKDLYKNNFLTTNNRTLEQSLILNQTETEKFLNTNNQNNEEIKLIKKTSSLNYEDEKILESNKKRILVRSIKSVYDSLSENEDKKKRRKNNNNNNFYLNPNCLTKLVIDCFCFFITIFSLFFLPLKLIYFDDINEYSIIFELFCDVIMVADFFTSFFIAYYDFEENFINSIDNMFINYIRSYLFVDLLSCIPFNSIIEFQTYYEDFISVSQINNSSTSKNNYVNKMFYKNKMKEYNHYYENGVYDNEYFPSGYVKDFNYLIFINFGKINRLWKIFRLFKMFKITTNNEFINRLSTYYISDFSLLKTNLKLLSYYFYFFIISHILSCIFIFLGTVQYPNWIINSNLNNSNFAEIYLASLYFNHTTIFTVGYGDILSKNFYERTYNIILMIVGIMLYSFALTSISNIIKINDDKTKDFEKKKEYLNELREKYNLNEPLYDNIRRFLFYQMKTDKSNKMDLLNALPITLKNEMIINMHRKVIDSFNFFKDIYDNDFIIHVILSLQPTNALRNDILIKQGDFIEEIIFIKNGILQLDTVLNFKDTNLDFWETSTNTLQTETCSNQTKDQNYFIDINQNLKKYQKTSITRNDDSKQIKDEKILHNNISIEKIKILDLRKNEHFGDALMIENERSPLTLRTKTKSAELFLMNKLDVIKISDTYTDIFEKIYIKSSYNFMQIIRKVEELRINQMIIRKNNLEKKKKISKSNIKSQNFNYFPELKTLNDSVNSKCDNSKNNKDSIFSNSRGKFKKSSLKEINVDQLQNIKDKNSGKIESSNNGKNIINVQDRFKPNKCDSFGNHEILKNQLFFINNEDVTNNFNKHSTIHISDTQLNKGDSCSISRKESNDKSSETGIILRKLILHSDEKNNIEKKSIYDNYVNDKINIQPKLLDNSKIKNCILVKNQSSDKDEHEIYSFMPQFTNDQNFSVGIPDELQDSNSSINCSKNNISSIVPKYFSIQDRAIKHLISNKLININHKNIVGKSNLLNYNNNFNFASNNNTGYKNSHVSTAKFFNEKTESFYTSYLEPEIKEKLKSIKSMKISHSNQTDNAEKLINNYKSELQSSIQPSIKSFDNDDTNNLVTTFMETNKKKIEDLKKKIVMTKLEYKNLFPSENLDYIESLNEKNIFHSSERLEKIDLLASYEHFKDFGLCNRCEVILNEKFDKLKKTKFKEDPQYLNLYDAKAQNFIIDKVDKFDIIATTASDDSYAKLKLKSSKLEKKPNRLNFNNEHEKYLNDILTFGHDLDIRDNNVNNENEEEFIKPITPQKEMPQNSNRCRSNNNYFINPNMNITVTLPQNEFNFDSNTLYLNDKRLIRCSPQSRHNSQFQPFSIFEKNWNDFRRRSVRSNMNNILGNLKNLKDSLINKKETGDTSDSFNYLTKESKEDPENKRKTFRNFKIGKVIDGLFLNTMDFSKLKVNDINKSCSSFRSNRESEKGQKTNRNAKNFTMTRTPDITINSSFSKNGRGITLEDLINDKSNKFANRKLSKGDSILEMNLFCHKNKKIKSSTKLQSVNLENFQSFKNNDPLFRQKIHDNRLINSKINTKININTNKHSFKSEFDSVKKTNFKPKEKGLSITENFENMNIKLDNIIKMMVK